MRRNVADALQHSEGDVGRRDLKSEILADEAGDLALVLERIGQAVTPPALWPNKMTGTPGSRNFANTMSLVRSST